MKLENKFLAPLGVKTLEVCEELYLYGDGYGQRYGLHGVPNDQFANLANFCHQALF